MPTDPASSSDVESESDVTPHRREQEVTGCLRRVPSVLSWEEMKMFLYELWDKAYDLGSQDATELLTETNPDTVLADLIVRGYLQSWQEPSGLVPPTGYDEPMRTLYERVNPPTAEPSWHG